MCAYARDNIPCLSIYLTMFLLCVVSHFRTLVTMALRDFLSFVDLNNFSCMLPLLNPILPTIYLTSLGRLCVVLLCLSCLQSDIFMSHRHLNCFFLIFHICIHFLSMAFSAPCCRTIFCYFTYLFHSS